MEPPTVSVSEILAHCGVTADQLDRMCTSTDIAEIAGFLGSWREVAPHIGLDENDVKAIEEDGKDAADKRLKALQKWRGKFGYRASYKWLVNVLVKLKMTECAENVCKLLKSRCRPIPGIQPSYPAGTVMDLHGPSGATDKDLSGCTPGLRPTASLPTVSEGDISLGRAMVLLAQFGAIALASQTGQRTEENKSVGTPVLQPTVHPPTGSEGATGGDRGGGGGGEQPVATIPARQLGPLTKEESFDLSGAFAEMYSKLVPQLAKVITANSLKRYLLSLRHPTTDQLYVDPLLYQHLTSTEDILDALQKDCYFRPIQTGLLEKIVESHGCDECKHLLREYELKIPKTTPLEANELSDSEIDSSSSTKALKVKVDVEATSLSMKVIGAVQAALERFSRVIQPMIIYAKHESGSIVLTFLIPATMVEAFTNISPSEEEDLSYLANVGILSIQIDQVTVFSLESHVVRHKLGLCEDGEYTQLKPPEADEPDRNIAGPEWAGFQGQVIVSGERQAFLLASIGAVAADSPDVIPLQGAGELSEEDRRKLDSEGVPPDCCDDVSIVRARITLDPEIQLSGEEVSDTGRELTRGYVLGQLEEFLNSVEKPGATIYYIGHGKKRTGDWCFSDGFITFSDIIHLYHTTNIKGRVLGIVSNCSYSGAWVWECARYLDEQGVRACGHSAVDQGILLKAYASCKPSELANNLTFSVRGMVNDKNTGALLYWKDSRELQKSQHVFGIDFTKIRCGQPPHDPCSRTSPKYTWMKICQGLSGLLYIVRGTDRGRPAWHYVVLVDDEEMIRDFKEKTQGPAAGAVTIKVSDYGEVVRSGWGKDPPNDVKEEIYEPYKY